MIGLLLIKLVLKLNKYICLYLLVCSKKGKLWKIGNSVVVTVPAQYISNGMMDTGKEYEFIAAEVKEDEHIE